MRELDVVTGDGRTLHAYDRGGEGFPVFYLHGTPNLGPPPEPWAAEADRLGLRLLGYDRPGYGGSTPRPGRDVASAAADVATIADSLGLGRIAVVGHSGGAPHALACAALLGDRVTAAAAVSGLAPLDAEDLDPFAGMAPHGAASLRAALAGRSAKERFEAEAADGDESPPDIGFTPSDWDALAGRWSWVMTVVGPAAAAGPAAAIDDDLATAAPWGFAHAAIRVPVLVVHGSADRMVPPAHGRWTAAHVPGAEYLERPGDGHVTVLDAGPDILRWLRDRS